MSVRLLHTAGNQIMVVNITKCMFVWLILTDAQVVLLSLCISDNVAAKQVFTVA